MNRNTCQYLMINEGELQKTNKAPRNEGKLN